MRDRVLDQAKGIAIFSVVAGHITSKDTWLTVWLYSFHIPLFLFVSGCLQAKRPSEFSWKFVRKEIRVLLYPFVVFSILKGLLNYGLTGKIQELIDPLIRIPLMAGDGALWYLPAFFLAMLLFVALRTWKKKEWGLWVLIITIMISQAVSDHHPARMESAAYYINLINHVLILCIFLFAGFLYEKYRNMLPKTPWMILNYGVFLGTAFILSQVNQGVDIHYSDINNPFLFYSAAMLSCIGIMGLLRILNQNLPILQYYGKNSLIVYLTHTTFHMTGMIKTLVLQVTDNMTLMILYSTILVLLLEIPVIWFFNHWGKWLIHMPRSKHETAKST